MECRAVKVVEIQRSQEKVIAKKKIRKIVQILSEGGESTLTCLTHHHYYAAELGRAWQSSAKL
jgi:hypothetical protein